MKAYSNEKQERFMFSSIRKISSRIFCGIMILLVCGVVLFGQPLKGRRSGVSKTVQLPEPNLTSSVSVEEVIGRQQSIRGFADKAISYTQIGQLAWAGLAIANKDVNNRGSSQLELYFLTAEGLFSYQPGTHSLEQVSQTDLRKQLSVTVNQEAVARAGCDIIIAGAMKKTALRTGTGGRVVKFMTLEAGRAAENIQLQASAMGLGTMLVDEFETREIERVCRLSGENEPLLIAAVGFSAEPNSQEGLAAKSTVSAGKAVLIVPSGNFRDEELFGTQRILKGAGATVVLASSKSGTLQGMSGGIVNSEVTLDKVKVEDFNAVVFIGGTGAVEYFSNSPALAIARQAAAGHKIIAAISTAPAILANAGILKGIRSTGFISERGQMLQGGAKYTGATLERDGLIITCSDFSAVTTFARAIVAAIADTNRHGLEH